MQTLQNHNPSLSLEKVSKKFGETKVLDELDFKLFRGESVALCGASGSGKTTLLQIAGLLSLPDSGKVIIAQDDCSGSSTKRLLMRRKKIGYVYQFHHLIENLSAVDNIALPAMISGLSHKLAIEKAQATMEEIGIDKLNDRAVTTLSGGEKQRVAVARALVMSPDLVIADEPTGNLDPQNALKVFNLLVASTKRHKSSLLVATHNYELIDLVNRQITLLDGKIEELSY